MHNLSLKLLASLYGIIRASNSLPIFNFHAVLPEKDPIQPYAIDAASFEILVSFLSKNFNIITLRDAVNKTLLPDRPAVITFDDGYLNNYSIAFPILQKYGVPAIFFIASGFFDNGWMWNNGIFHAVTKTRYSVLDCSGFGYGCYSVATIFDKRATVKKLIERLKYVPSSKRSELVFKVLEIASVEEPKGIMMNESHIAALYKAGMSIGGHTVNHPILSKVEDKEAFRQIKVNKATLESIIHQKIDCFAYPNGRTGKDYKDIHIKMLRDIGYKVAVTTEQRLYHPSDDYFQIPRYTPWKHDPHGFGLMLLEKTFKDRIQCFIKRIIN